MDPGAPGSLCTSFVSALGVGVASPCRPPGNFTAWKLGEASRARPRDGATARRPQVLASQVSLTPSSPPLGGTHVVIPIVQKRKRRLRGRKHLARVTQPVSGGAEVHTHIYVPEPHILSHQSRGWSLG